MIDRYTRPAMARIWSPENRLRLQLEVELLAVDGWSAIGAVPAADAESLRVHARLDPARMAELEARTGHDVASFVEAVAETAGPAGRWLHFGLTSNDVNDTTLAVQLVQATDLLLTDLDELDRAVLAKARALADTPQIGRTHGVHAEPITAGLMFARWHAEIARGRARLQNAREEIRVGKVSGPVGTYAGLDPRIERLVCERLGLRPARDATQIVARDRHAAYLCALAVLGGSLEYFATTIRGLQRTEVREVEEPFRGGQKGSSSMPHKRNPEKCERICGQARLLRAYALAGLEDQALWFERDISHSSVERVILPDATVLLDYMLGLLTEIVAGLHVYPEAMAKNLAATRGLWSSGPALNALIGAGLPREEAYRLVQEHAQAAWGGGPTFEERLTGDPRLSPEARAALVGSFDVAAQLRHVPEILADLGVGGSEA
jgi:adenylosuccinate lyase